MTDTTIPQYAMLDLHMALYGVDADFDGYYRDHGYAEAWARLLAAVRELHVSPTDDEREARAIVRRAVGGVLFHVTNFPERAQSHLVGENMGPLNEKITDAVLDALRRSEVPEPSARCPKCGATVTDQTPSTFYTNHDETCGGPLEEPQGEPSDAQEYECRQDRACAFGTHSVECDEGNARAAGGVR